MLRMNKKNYFIITGITLLVLFTGCSEDKEVSNEIRYEIMSFSILPEPEDDFRTFVVSERIKDDKKVIFSDENNIIRKHRLAWAFNDEEKERVIDERTRNFRRIIDDELIIGYSDELDEFYYRTRSIECIRDFDC